LILLTRPPRRSPKRLLGAALDTAVRASRGQLGPRGPQAVAASLERGLAEIGEPFELNPRRLPGGDGVVGVLSDLDALAAAIEWRRGHSGRRLLAGPNLVILPSDAPDLMAAPEVDLCVVPSDWVKDLYEEDTPQLRGRVAVWPAGVDAGYWSPGDGGRRALIYVKRLPGQRNVTEDELQATREALAGYEVTELEYGSFTRDQYRDALREAALVVFFSPSESQCLAQVEAWSADVPTFVWNCARWEHGGRVRETSSAPYLSDRTGALFDDPAELPALLQRRDSFSPRAWVLEHMTDAVCAAAYRDLAPSIGVRP
jgi:hypothetical protein